MARMWLHSLLCWLGAALALALLAALPDAARADSRPHLRIATTTSLDNSGLLQKLMPPFEDHCSCRVDWIAVGTGHALALGRKGEVDVVLVHAPDAEARFVADGYGVKRTPFMMSDFVLVGPPANPAGLRTADPVAGALARIARAKVVFVSRGDDSGTHRREQQLWQSAGIIPSGHWYRSVGQGMGRTLIIADQMEGYTLTDRATFLALSGKLKLRILLAGDAQLNNPYSVIPVVPRLRPHGQPKLAARLVQWLAGADAKPYIDGFTIGAATPFEHLPRPH